MVSEEGEQRVPGRSQLRLLYLFLLFPGDGVDFDQGGSGDGLETTILNI